MITKTLQLISLIPRKPAEFLDRVAAIASSRWHTGRDKRMSYQTTTFQEAVRALSSVLNSNCADWLLESALAQVEVQVLKRQASLSHGGPFAEFHNGDSALARLCYVTARALRPRLVVETGVCYGVTSAYILKAIDVNHEGHLHSVDLPPLGKDADRHVGRLIPEELRDRWTLHRGVSGRVLSPLLGRLGNIDLFMHDSLHTYGTMRDEFAVAWPFLRPGGVLISDDVEGNTAFQELAAKPDVASSMVVEEQGKDALLGIAVKRT